MSSKLQANHLKVIFFFYLCIIMPGIVKPKCTPTMGKQVIHCSNGISSIQELNEEIDWTTSVIVIRDFEELEIAPDEHLNEKFHSVTSYQFLRINQLELSENSFLGLSNLLILKFFDSNVGTLRNNVFKGLHSLELLELTNCGIKHVDDKAFNGLNNLQSLDLTNNNIKTISKRIFQNVPNLNSLALYKNEIDRIDVDCFSDLTKLTTLGLSANKLKTITTETFNAIPNLTYLYVSFNQIDKIVDDFKCLDLKFVNFGHNRLESVSRNLFKSCTSLVDIDLAFNNLEHINEHAFDNLPKLMNLHLRNCTIDVSKLKFIHKPLIVL